MTCVHAGAPHLDGADLLAAAVDELLEAPRQRQEAVAVQEALVPGVEPAACAFGKFIASLCSEQLDDID